jgi:Uncharacterized protein conserved in bacteria (DUF2252)
MITEERPATNKIASTERPTPEQRASAGKAARAKAPPESHAECRPQRSRDPLAPLLSQAKTRVPELVPIRHGRMLVSPFTFYRGAAPVMAADLDTTPTSGLRTQLCGDGHSSSRCPRTDTEFTGRRTSPTCAKNAQYLRRRSVIMS